MESARYERILSDAKAVSVISVRDSVNLGFNSQSRGCGSSTMLGTLWLTIPEIDRPLAHLTGNRSNRLRLPGPDGLGYALLSVAGVIRGPVCAVLSLSLVPPEPSVVVAVMVGHLLLPLLLSVTTARANTFRPLAPGSLSAAYNKSSQLQWRTDPYNGMILNKQLLFELCYWPKDKLLEKKFKEVTTHHMTIEGFELQLNTVYVASVRCKPNKVDPYRGQWSTWSTECEWSTETDTGAGSPTRGDWSHLMLVLFIPLSLAALISIILYFKIPSRFVGKINQVVIHVPNPAAFFQPLYTEHNGNFKDWVESGGSVTMAAVPAEGKRPLESELPVSVLDSQPKAMSSVTSWTLLPTGKCCSEAELGDGDCPCSQSEILPGPGDELRSAYGWQYLGGGPQLAMGSRGWLPPEGSSVALLFPFPWDRGPSSCYSDEYCTLSHSDLSHGLLTLASQPPASAGSGRMPPVECQTGSGSSWPEREAGKSGAMPLVCE
eukprot:gi/632975051/ref/XP_007904012.1/ PREDICTED: interleukin-9 receptor-like [Callorhinchus milii]